MPAKLETTTQREKQEPVTVPRLPDDASTESTRTSASQITAPIPGAPAEASRPSADDEDLVAPDLSLVGLSGQPSTIRPATHVLRREEATRAMGFARGATLLSVIGLLSQPLLSGAALWLRVLAIVAMAALLAASAFVWRIAKDPLTYTRKAARVYAGVCAGGALVLQYYLGVFSPAPMLVVLGIAFFAAAEDRLVSLALPLVSAAGYVLLSSAIVFGLLPDAGVMPAGGVPREVSVAMIAVVPLVYLFALWQSKLSRHAMLEAVRRSNEQIRERVHREAKLEEANRDIDMLLRVGVRHAGPYSGVACGKYVLGDLIGRGAMGEVYSAKHADSGQTAAVKLLQPNMLDDAHLVLRFLREGEAASKLRGPNVVKIFEVGQTDQGAPYIAMELLRGHDLAWHLQHRIHLSLDEVLGIVDQVGMGLEAARVAGIVHRDLKPQNLFLAQQPGDAPLWKILDFGVSRLIGSGGTLTQEGIVGTPGYMSPEQAAGREATHRSDVFSFGVVVYRALTGEPPFTGPDTPQILYQVVYSAPTRPSELVRALPADVDLVIAIALAKDPEDRFSSAIEMANALRAAANSELDAGHRLHAQTILAGLPWGRVLGGGSVSAG